MEENNKDIRLFAKGSGVPLWKVCLVLKISEPTLTRRLRKKLPNKEKAEILRIIKDLSEKGGKRL